MISIHFLWHNGFKAGLTPELVFQNRQKNMLSGRTDGTIYHINELSTYYLKKQVTFTISSFEEAR